MASDNCFEQSFQRGVQLDPEVKVYASFMIFKILLLSESVSSMLLSSDKELSQSASQIDKDVVFFKFFAL